MKRVTINYRKVRTNELAVAKGRTNDLAIRNIVDHKGQAIHAAGGRLSLDALLKRASKTNIDILNVVVNGKVKYESGQTPEVKPVVKQQDTIKFMRSRFTGKCSETGKAVSKGDIIFYNRSTKKVFCSDSFTYSNNLKDETIYGWELTQQPKVEEVIPKVEEVKDDSQVTPKVDKPSGGNRALFDQFVAPYLDEIKIDDAKLKTLVTDAVRAVTRKIEIKINDEPVIKVEGQHKNFDRLFKYCVKRKNVLLVGAAGTGKTHTGEVIANMLKLEYASISVNMATQKHEFFGYMEATGNYVTTPFRKLFEHGGVFLLDEFDAGNANALTAINMASSNGGATFPDGHIRKHKDFVLIASANTFGLGANYEYVGRNKLDAATRNRFAKVFWDYDEVMELALTPNERWTKYCQNIRRVVAELKIIDVIISIRQMKDGGDMLEVMDRADVEEDYIFADMKQADVAKIRSRVTF